MGKKGQLESGAFTQKPTRHPKKSQGHSSRKNQDKKYRGWHSSPTGKMGISDPEKSGEGVGYYIAFDKDTAKSFGRKFFRVSATLRNPLNAVGEPAYILHESDEIFKPSKKTDSEWLSANKEAVKRSGTTDENWGRNQPQLNQALTDVLQERGYDGLLIEDWMVKFAKPSEREKLKGYTIDEKLLSQRASKIPIARIRKAMLKAHPEDVLEKNPQKLREHFISDYVGYKEELGILKSDVKIVEDEFDKAFMEDRIKDVEKVVQYSEKLLKEGEKS